MDAEGLLPEKIGPFLLVRAGIPAVLGCAGLLAALAEPSGRGWYLLGSMACVAELWTAFQPGSDFLRSRRAWMRREGAWVRAFRPLARLLGREEAWLLSFCHWNNRKVRQHFEAHRARKALVLLPHCIQAAQCKAPVCEGLGNCFACGQCPVGDVRPDMIAGKWDCRLFNRSHKAYREARACEPDLVVAVTCADRLFKGLTRMPEVPCYVIPLQLPHGMCVDTTFSVPGLAAAMERLVEKRQEGNVRPLQVGAGA